jgi:MoaA/NifB/PqqE/SkfB family radical SAM enzyme
VPEAVYRRVIDEVAPKKVHVYITGGEPFLYRPLVPLVNYMKENCLTVQIVTNGVGLETNAEDIVDNGWDMVCVSFDGPPEVHDKCRGVHGAMEKAVDGIKRIQELKAEKKTSKPGIYVLTTISMNNQYALVDTVKEAEKIRPDGMIIYYSWFTNEEIGQRHTEIYKRNWVSHRLHGRVTCATLKRLI